MVFLAIITRYCIGWTGSRREIHAPEQISIPRVVAKRVVLVRVLDFRQSRETLGISFFQIGERLIFIPQAMIYDGKVIGRDVSLLCHLLQVGEHLQRFVFPARYRISIGKIGKSTPSLRKVIQFSGFLQRRNGFLVPSRFQISPTELGVEWGGVRLHSYR